MTRRTDQLKLGAFLANSGHHLAAWRHPLGQADASLDFEHFKTIAETAERGKFDALFVADVVALWGHHHDALSRCARAEHFEPLTLMSALAAVTRHIGLIATATTSYNEPYHIARKFASLDHLSKGRAAWNLVTSVVSDEAWNFGRESHIDHGDRYQRAEEFHDVVKGLWDSWDDDAFVRDAGTLAVPPRIRRPHPAGKPRAAASGQPVQPIMGGERPIEGRMSEFGRRVCAPLTEPVHGP